MLLSTPGPVAANTWVAWDVTGAVQGNGTVSLAVMPTGTDGTVLYSRDTSLAACKGTWIGTNRHPSVQTLVEDEPVE
ncbi:MAG TPA: hypothetical protein VNA24_04505 [Hyalangium sp.]|jgi:hypothetical protein|nr:hypothetical protein [Hyalangium sp.]